VTAPALLVTGEAGVGKSRLVLEAARATGAPCTECRCSSYHETTSLYPFRPLLEAACDIAGDDGPDTRLRKLRTRLRSLDANGADLPFLTAALQIPPTAVAPPPDVDPSRLRELALAAAAQLVRFHLGDGPRVLFVDDWIDTGGQALGAYGLVKDAGAHWIGAAVVVDALSEPRVRRDLVVKSLLRNRELWAVL